eukprot:12965476-Alexandrium_andersonii.AAC.1
MHNGLEEVLERHGLRRGPAAALLHHPVPILHAAGQEELRDGVLKRQRVEVRALRLLAGEVLPEVTLKLLRRDALNLHGALLARVGLHARQGRLRRLVDLSLIHISEPTRLALI